MKSKKTLLLVCIQYDYLQLLNFGDPKIKEIANKTDKRDRVTMECWTKTEPVPKNKGTWIEKERVHNQKNI